MSDLYWLTDEQVARLSPYFPKSHGKPRVDDRRVLSGIIFVNRNGLRWRDAPREYGPHKTLYNRWKRWGEMGVFTRMMEGLAAERAKPETVMIDATYLKAHRTASSLGVKRGSRASDWTDERRHEHEIARHHRCQRSSFELLHHGRAGQRLHRCRGLARRSAQGQVGCSPIAAMTLTGSEMRWSKRASNHAFRAVNPAHRPSITTSGGTNGVTASRSCSVV